MWKLSGKTSDRIRAGEIPADSIHPERRQPDPKPSAVRHAKGQGLGRGAEAKRH